MNEKQFIAGFYSNDVADTAPDWILGKGSIKVSLLKEWLEENKHLADGDGFIRYTIKRSQTTKKRYVEVDTWKPTPRTQPDGTAYPQDDNGAVAAIETGTHPVPTSDDQFEDIAPTNKEAINPEDIPF